MIEQTGLPVVHSGRYNFIMARNNSSSSCGDHSKDTDIATRDYALFLKDLQRKVCPFGFVDSERIAHVYSIRKKKSNTAAWLPGHGVEPVPGDVSFLAHKDVSGNMYQKKPNQHMSASLGMPSNKKTVERKQNLIIRHLQNVKTAAIHSSHSGIFRHTQNCDYRLRQTEAALRKEMQRAQLLWKQLRSAEYVRQHQQQAVNQLQLALVQLRSRHDRHIHLEMRERKNMEETINQQLRKERAELSKAVTDRDMIQTLLQQLQHNIMEDRFHLELLTKEHQTPVASRQLHSSIYE